LKETTDTLAKEYREIIDKQNEIILGLISTYELVELIAEKQGIKIPKPKISMDIEE